MLLYTDLKAPLNEEKPPESDCAKDGNAISTVYGNDYTVESPGDFGYSFYLVMCSMFIYCIGIGLSIHAQMTRKRKFGEGKTNEIANPAHDVAIMF